jgi:hypothetical protein
VTLLRDIGLVLEVTLLIVFALVVAATLITQRPARAHTYKRTHHARHA